MVKNLNSKNQTTTSNKSVEQNLLQALDLRFRRTTGVAVELLARFWGVIPLVFVVYLSLLKVLETNWMHLYIWIGAYIFYLIILEYTRFRTKILYQSNAFRLIRITAGIIFISWSLAIFRNFLGAIELLYVLPIFASLASFPNSRRVHLLVIFGTLVGLLFGRMVFSSGVPISIMQYIVISIVLISLSAYLALANRIPIINAFHFDVSEVLRELYNTQELHELLEKIIKIAVLTSGADKAILVIVDPSNQNPIEYVVSDLIMQEGCSIESFLKDCEVIKTGKPFECPNMPALYGVKSIYNKYFSCHPRSVIAEPVFNYDGEIVGVLSVLHQSANQFDVQIQTLIRYFSFLVIAPIENAINYENERLKASRAEVASKLLHGLDSESEIISDLLESAQKLVPNADKFIVHRYYPASRRLEPTLLTTQNNEKKNLSLELLPELHGFQIDEGVAGKALAKQETMLISDTSSNELFLNRDSANSIRSLLVSPFFDSVTGELFGTVSAYNSQPNKFTQEDKYSLQELTTHGSAAISWAREFTNRRRQGGVMKDIVDEVMKFDINSGEEYLCQQITNASTKLLGFSIARMRLYDSGTRELVTFAMSGVPNDVLILEKHKNIPLKAIQVFLNPKFLHGASYLISHYNEEWKVFAENYFYMSPAAKARTSGWREYDSLLTPLVDKSGQIIGLLTLDEPIDNTILQSRAFDTIIEAIAVFASATTWAIELTRLENRLNEQRRRADSFIQTISESFAKSKDFSSLGEVVVQIGAEFLNAEGCSLYLVNGNEIRLTHSNYLSGTPYIGRAKALNNRNGQGLTSWVAINGLPYSSNNGEFKNHEAWSGESDHLVFLPSKVCNSVLLAPVIDKNKKTVGVISLENKKNNFQGQEGFSENDISRLNYLAMEFSQALEMLKNYEIVQRWERKGNEDDLHDLINWYHSGVVTWIDALDVWLSRDNVEKAREMMPNLSRHAHTTVDELKTIHTTMMSKSLEFNDLREALESVITAWSKRVHKKYQGALPIKLICPSNMELPTSVRINLVRIGLCAIANAVLHSGIDEDPDVNIRIAVFKNQGRLVLTVTDTGRGADPLIEGYGIGRMRFLAKELNDLGIETNLNFQSKLTLGTKVTIVLHISEYDTQTSLNPEVL